MYALYDGKNIIQVFNSKEKAKAHYDDLMSLENAEKDYDLEVKYLDDNYLKDIEVEKYQYYGSEEES